MKTKFKSGNAAVHFLLFHGEKLGILAIVVCVVLLIWSAVGRDQLDSSQTPDNLNRSATSATQRISGYTWTSADPEVKIVADDTLDVDTRPIAPEDFPPFALNWNRPVVEPMGRRTDPAILTIEKLEAHGDYGLWATSDPAKIAQAQLQAMAEDERLQREEDDLRDREGRERGAGGPRGRGPNPDRGFAAEERQPPRRGGTIVEQPSTGARLSGFEDIVAKSWVTVVAKVPIKKQSLYYDEALQSALGYNASADIPIYLGYTVERAEITDDGQGDWKSLPVVNSIKVLEDLKQYPVEVPDVVPEVFKHPILSYPLPPLILREWDDRATHSSIPLIEEYERQQLEAEAGAGESPTEETPAGEVDPFAQGRPREDFSRGGEEMDGGGEFRRGGFRRDGGGPAFRGEFDDTDGDGGGAGRYRRGGGYSEYGGQRGRGSGATLGEFTWDRKTESLLFRYFDYTAQPGHRYRYRVQLALADVNNGVDEKYLDKSVLERRAAITKASEKIYRLTEWSDPSPIASVPLPARIYLVQAKPVKGNNVTSEPEAEVLIKMLDSAFAAELARTEKLLRGSVANFEDKAEVIWSNIYEVEGNKDPEFKFRTDITLLDFSGGEKLGSRSSDFIAPARALLMDAGGRLFVQSELDDAEAVAEFKQVIETGGENSRNNFRGGRGGFGGEFDEGF